jgi:RNA polymerase sigma-70 factor (ECF subfamily)
VVTLYDVQGLQHNEIAQILSISEGTVRSRLFYAHRILQGYLEDLVKSP